MSGDRDRKRMQRHRQMKACAASSHSRAYFHIKREGKSRHRTAAGKHCKTAKHPCCTRLRYLLLLSLLFLSPTLRAQRKT